MPITHYFLIAIFVFITGCSRLEHVKVEMASMVDSCEVVPFSSYLYDEFKINKNNNFIIEYTYQIPQRKYISNCYIDTLWGPKMYLEASTLEHHQIGSKAFIKAPDKKELNYKFTCSALLDLPFHEEVMDQKIRKIVITKNKEGLYSCQTSPK